MLSYFQMGSLGSAKLWRNSIFFRFGIFLFLSNCTPVLNTSEYAKGSKTNKNNFELWLAYHFPNSQSELDSAQMANLDNDGDGTKNLLEYALGGDPNNPSLDTLPLFEVEGGTHLKSEFQVSSHPKDIEVSIEVSSDHITWNNGEEFINFSMEEMGSEIVKIIAGDKVSILESPQKKRFMRIKATLKEDEAVYTTSPAYGASLIDILGGPAGAADNMLAFSKSLRPEFRGKISSFESNFIFVTGDPNWEVDQFKYAAGIQSNNYYVEIKSGEHEGKIFPIVGNTENGFEILNSQNISLSDGESLSIIPYWNLKNAFAGSDAIVPSSSTSLLQRQTQVLFFSDTYNGINISSNAIYFLQGELWKRSGSGNTDFGDTIIDPRLFTLIRTKSTFVGDTTYLHYGYVHEGAVSSPIRIRAGGAQETFVNIKQPQDLTLNQIGLHNSGIFSQTIDFNNPTDTVRIYDPSVRTTNPAILKYFYYNGGWRKEGADPTEDFGDAQLLKANAGFRINKAAATNDGYLYWTFNP